MLLIGEFKGDFKVYYPSLELIIEIIIKEKNIFMVNEQFVTNLFSLQKFLSSQLKYRSIETSNYIYIYIALFLYIT